MMIAILTTHDLTIGYRSPRQPDLIVAQEINLALKGGELVCLLGPNGAGKSTLMRTIAGMQRPLAGQVTLAGVDIAQLKPRQRAERLSVVLTERPNLGLLNGYALVALGRHPYTDWTGRLTRYDEAVIRWAVEAVDAADLADRPVMELSDGQRQKLMIARALAQESELIMLDEPTAYLDLPRRAEIMRLLRHLAAETGRAILLSTHDLDLALRSADTLWLLAGGTVRVGAPEDLVISGAFEAAFRGEGVTFDRATGAFSVERACGYMISVVGQGVPHVWTCRALQRAGYALATDADTASAISVAVSGDEYQPVWHLQRGGARSTHHSIRDLLAAL
ncbi:MAG: ABC transporter ATP-binding protein [Chloroflexi bacterium]|nr:ABC transporter ATP-binding protein [Chloroflexota bacterium]